VHISREGKQNKRNANLKERGYASHLILGIDVGAWLKENLDSVRLTFARRVHEA